MGAPPPTHSTFVSASEHKEATAAAATAKETELPKAPSKEPISHEHIQATIFRYLTVKAYHNHTVTMSPQPQLWSEETPPLTRWEFDDAMRPILVEVDKALVVVRPGSSRPRLQRTTRSRRRSDRTSPR